jgi:FkbM family methyltransferase
VSISEKSEFLLGYLVGSRHGDFLCPAYDNCITKGLLDDGDCKTDEIELLKQVVGAGDRVLIVGAHIGTVAIPVAKFCLELVAIEANPRTYKFLERNVMINKSENIRTLSLAAAQGYGEVDFIANQENSGGSKIAPKIPHPHYFSETHDFLRVHCAPLDQVLGDVFFRILFMDIEGSEYPAFLGMPNLLRNAEVLFVEFIPHHLQFVAQVSPEEFLGPLEACFNFLYIPGLKTVVKKEDFSAVLRRLYDLNFAQDQIVFSKNLDTFSGFPLN